MTAPVRAGLTVFCLLLFCMSVRADIAVVVNIGNSVDELSEKEVRDLFMGRYAAFPNGAPAVPLDQPVSSDVRKQFYRYLTGKSVSQINAYWAKLIFSGRASPPRMVSSSETVYEMLENNKGVIAYIPAAKVNDNTKIVFVLKTP